MNKVILIEVSTDMANRELSEWVIKALERQNGQDPARRKVELKQKPHVQKVQGK